MKRSLLFLVLFSCALMSNTLQAQNCVPTGANHPSEGTYTQDVWTAYVYDRSLWTGAKNYEGYYQHTATTGTLGLDFNTEDYWNKAKNPSHQTHQNAAYKGCSMDDDYFNVDYRRKGFPRGYYEITITHDDWNASVSLNGTEIYSSFVSANQRLIANTHYLDQDTELQVEWAESVRNSNVSIQFNRISIGFGQDEWLAAVFSDDSFTNYAGQFSQSGLDFTSPWSSTQTPSDAPGYTGASISNNTSYIYRRRGFDCGFYSIDVTEYDDDTEIIIDGQSVWSKTGYNLNGETGVWTGVLGADTEMEVKVRNNGSGPTSIGLQFNRLDQAPAGTVVWTGKLNNRANDAANWCPALPGPNDQVYIPKQSLTPNNLKLNVDAEIGSLYIADSAVVDLQDHQLMLNGDFELQGALVNNQIGFLGFAGNQASIKGKAFEVDQLQISGQNVNIATYQNLRVRQWVRLTAGSLNTNDKLTLSCAFVNGGTELGQIDEIPNGSTINGEVLVEQCIPARRGFRLVTSQVTTSTSIHDNWQEGALQWDHNPHPSNGNRPGYGTHITGTTSDQTNGFDLTASGNPSMFEFNNASQTWSPIANTDATNLTAGQPWRLMVRGDRSTDITSNAAAPTNTILRAQGDLVQGDIDMATNFNATAGAFNLVGNPYAAAVDLRELMRNSKHISKLQVYMWDVTEGGLPIVGQPGGRGAFVTIDLENPIESIVGSLLRKQYIQPGQAVFMVARGSGTPELIFKESYKEVEAPIADVFRAPTEAFMDIQLFDQNSLLNGGSTLDALRLKWKDTYTSLAGEEDAAKMGNLDENLAVVNNQNYLSIDRRAFPQQEEVLPLFINQYRHNDYVLRFNNKNSFEHEVYLIDYYLNTETPIQGDAFTHAFQVDPDVEASTDPMRFALKFKPQGKLNTDTLQEETWSIYPNPLRGNQLQIQLPQQATGTRVQIQISDMLGKVVWSETQTPQQKSLSLESLSLKAGMYLVSMQTAEGQYQTQKLVVE